MQNASQEPWSVLRSDMVLMIVVPLSIICLVRETTVFAFQADLL